jgi:hypothetical protein
MTAFVAMGLPQKTSLVSLANRLLLTVNANQFVSVRLVLAPGMKVKPLVLAMVARGQGHVGRLSISVL